MPEAGLEPVTARESKALTKATIRAAQKLGFKPRTLSRVI
jgi:hypothetical protein